MPTLLKDLSINEVSSVDRGAGEDVKVVLMKRDNDAVEAYLKRNLFEEARARAGIEKRDFSEKERDKLAESGAALPDGSFPIENKSDLENAIQAYGRAADKEKAKAHILSRAKDLGATDLIPESWTKRDIILAAVKKSGFLPSVDPDNDAKTWADALQEQAFWDQYWKGSNALQDSIRSIIEDDDATDKAGMIGQSLAQFNAFMSALIPEQIGKSLAALLAASAGSAGISKGDVMSDDIKKALGLLPTATDAQVAAAFAKRDQEQTAAVAKLQSELAIMKMSDAHKQYATDTKMSDDAKAKFAAKSAEERDQQMKDNPVEKGLPESVVKQLAEAADFKKRLADLEAKDKAAGFEKRAIEIGLSAAEGVTLQKAHAGDPEAVKKLEEIIKAAATQEKTAALFKSFGSDNANPSGASGHDQLVAKAAELQKADPKLTREQAYTKAYTDPANKDIVALVKREEQSGRAA